MLQNPSKYHPNPLSHFLAFHNSTNLHQIHHHQQQQQQSHYPQNQLNESMPNGSLEANLTNTQLDVGKSFTIAAILGLQKNAIENSQKEFNSVMNLSINSSSNNQNTNSSNSFINGTNSSNSENNAIHMQNQHNQKSTNLSALHNALNVNGFNCDNMNSNIVNRYLPTPNGGGGGGGTVSSNPNSNHLRMNNFGHAVSAVAAVAANGTPSALQSLQQLHQQHAQQTSIGFQARDKARIDNLTSKKSSLKSKRVRTIFTPEQLERLEAEFERQQYMVGPERLYLAHTLQLTEAQVKVWFQNRRIKWRKHHLEITQQRLALIRQRQISPNESSTNNRSDGGGGGLSQLPNHLHRSESDLSICNDSMDTESIKDGEEV